MKRKKIENQSDLFSDFYGAEQAPLQQNSPSTKNKNREIKIMEARKNYTQKEIMAATTKYFGGDELAANVWMNKYALRDGDRKSVV